MASLGSVSIQAVGKNFEENCKISIDGKDLLRIDFWGPKNYIFWTTCFKTTIPPPPIPSEGLIQLENLAMSACGMFSLLQSFLCLT